MGEQEERLRAQIEAYHASALLFAAVKLGLTEQMGDRCLSAGELAAELRLSPQHLHRFLRGLTSIGVYEELADGSFALTELGRSLRRGSPSRLAEKVAIVVGQYWRPWADLLPTLETGGPAFERIFGMPVSEWRSAHAEQGALFNAYLAEETFATAGPIVEALDFSGARTVADIGGGYGGLLAAVLEAHPQLEGVLFDFPGTVEEALPFLQSHGVAERVRRVAGDFRVEVAVEVDLYLLKSVLQQWDDAGALTILRNLRAAMPAHAKLLIIERALPERAADDPAAVMLDLHMMTINGGRVRSLTEFQALLAQAGFKLAKLSPTRSGLSILEAMPV